MIIQTGQRTDIPAFYSEWFANRLKEGYVLVRNPFNRLSVTRYELNPEVVDLIGFCTKNPSPIFKYMDLLDPYNQYWFVTITPYGKDIEPNVPDKNRVMEDFKRLSDMVGVNYIAWRYDPIIIDDTWTIEQHFEEFEKMAEMLCGYTEICVISFIDLYQKVKKNYPEVKEIDFDTQLMMTEEYVRIAEKYGMIIRPCGESSELQSTGADCSGCMTLEVFEKVIGRKINAPANPRNRKECACYITGDIGQYNTCGHLCRYCYANADVDIVKKNMSKHDPSSPLLIGHPNPEDEIHIAVQTSWIEKQMKLEF